MKKPLDKKCRDIATACIASLLLVLTGCGESGGGPAGPPGAPRLNSGGPKISNGIMPIHRPVVPIAGPLGGPPVGLNPADKPDKEKPPENSDGNKNDSNPFAPVVKVEQAGNIVSLASEIIAAGANPFLSRMPKPIQTVTPDTDGSQSTVAAPPPPPVDPLDAVKLLGIVYSVKAPIALIMVEGAVSAASQLVKAGDVIELTDGQAIVARITQSSIDIHLLGPKKGKRTLPIPDIVGYAAASKGATASSPPPSQDMGGGSFNGSQSSTAQASGATSPMGGLGNGMTGEVTLSNLKKLAESLAGGAGSGQGKGAGSQAPNVVLTEP